jgi:hypothetical protein
MSNERDSPLVIKNFHDLLQLLVRVHFPESDTTSYWNFLDLRKNILHNCDMILLFLQVQEKVLPYRVDIYAAIDELRFDALNVKKACGKVPANFGRPGRRRSVKHLKGLYEQMRLAAVLLCQANSPELMDDVARALSLE